MRGEEGKGIRSEPQKAAVTNKTGNDVPRATGRPSGITHRKNFSGYYPDIESLEPLSSFLNGDCGALTWGPESLAEGHRG